MPSGSKLDSWLADLIERLDDDFEATKVVDFEDTYPGFEVYKEVHLEYRGDHLKLDFGITNTNGGETKATLYRAHRFDSDHQTRWRSLGEINERFGGRVTPQNRAIRTPVGKLLEKYETQYANTD